MTHVQRDPAQGFCILRAGGARPSIEAVIAFIDAYRDVCGVEPICRMMPIAPSTSYRRRAM
jgi:hypothetical protein